MGFQDALYLLNLPYDSQGAVDFADVSMEMISYYAILASTHLAEERGTYHSYIGSKWDRGILPIDTLTVLGQERGRTLKSIHPRAWTGMWCARQSPNTACETAT